MLIDDHYQKVLGYWDLMMKKCYLFTATVANYLEDIMFKLFGLKPDQYKRYRILMSNLSSASCTIAITYDVGKTKAEYWEMIKDRIINQSIAKPIIVFVKE